jgi:carbamoyltransferase
MLYVVPTKQSQRDKLPAVTHVDVVLNTSFNLKGEPVANTPADAASTFFRSEMDSLVIGDFLIEKAS